MPPKRKQPAQPKALDTRPVNQRGQEWQAEKLTGARAQKGNLPAPRRPPALDIRGMDNINNNKVLRWITLTTIRSG